MTRQAYVQVSSGRKDFYVAERKGHDQRYAIDPSKAMAELGWAPTTMFADGIKLTIQWYKNHMDWMAECTSGEYVRYYEEMDGKRREIRPLGYSCKMWLGGKGWFNY